MLDETPFEAAFLRAALLLGLIHEADVADWAGRRIATATQDAAHLADVLLTRAELTAMRDVLRPIGAGVSEDCIVQALLAAIATDPAYQEHPVRTQLAVLGQLRREFSLPSSVAAAIKAFEDRLMLADVKQPGESPPSRAELVAWLSTFRTDAYFRFYCDGVGEASGFLAAVSRLLVRNRTLANRPGEAVARVWVVPTGGQSARGFVLNEPAWRAVAREFVPVPIESRIPYPTLPSGLTPAFDESSDEPLGIDAAHAWVAG